MKMFSIPSAIFVALTLISLHVNAQSDCQPVVVGLAPCLQYIEGNATEPSSGCCTQLATILKTRPQCLCQVLNNREGSSLGVNVNQTLALALPKACNAQTPSVSLCQATSPAGSPVSAPFTPSGDGSRSSPSGDSSEGYSLKLPYSLVFTLVATLSYVTMFGNIS